jgi:hypothetical protein
LDQQEENRKLNTLETFVREVVKDWFAYLYELEEEKWSQRAKVN